MIYCFAAKTMRGFWWVIFICFFNFSSLEDNNAICERICLLNDEILFIDTKKTIFFLMTNSRAFISFSYYVCMCLIPHQFLMSHNLHFISLFYITSCAWMSPHRDLIIIVVVKLFFMFFTPLNFTLFDSITKKNVFMKNHVYTAMFWFKNKHERKIASSRQHRSFE